MTANHESELLREKPMRHAEPGLNGEFKLSRWLVYFASGHEWYAMGEFVSTDATSAIDRAIEIFGSGAGYRAEEIPWDAAPLPKFSRASGQK